MVMAMMSVLVVVRIVGVAGGVAIGMGAFIMMAVIVHMETRGGHVVPRMPVQPGRRCPGELERNDEHDDEGDETAHGVHSTERIVFTKAGAR